MMPSGSEGKEKGKEIFHSEHDKLCLCYHWPWGGAIVPFGKALVRTFSIKMIHQHLYRIPF